MMSLTSKACSASISGVIFVRAGSSMVRAERPNVPVIMITAYGDEDTKRHAIAQGAVGLLTKPIDFALLRQEIDARLNQAA
jgi:DNA-binding response OmpR family regulator